VEELPIERWEVYRFEEFEEWPVLQSNGVRKSSFEKGAPTEPTYIILTQEAPVKE
jgi:hypothetical protein